MRAARFRIVEQYLAIAPFVICCLMCEPARAQTGRLEESSSVVGIDPIIAVSGPVGREASVGPTLRSTRAGVAPLTLTAAWPSGVIAADSLNDNRGSRSRHVLVGILIGGVSGGALGGIAARSSTTGTSLDPTITTADVIGGALLGAIVGGIVGVFWPHS